ncbi:MAG TPA: peroxiredoxin [Candidatus Limnocylindrales bacterium]|nr:peroxiredoxin [Candidatus Limnocylindrales bacterium]
MTTDERSVPAVGDRAPDISLADEDGVVHRLADRIGMWTVVYFYPADDTPGCTTEACQFRDIADEFAAHDAAIWGISPDDGTSHRRFREKFDLAGTLLSDEDHAVAQSYGAWGTKTLYGRESTGIIRSTFLVGPDLRVRRSWPRVKADGHPGAVLAALAEERAADR